MIPWVLQDRVVPSLTSNMLTASQPSAVLDASAMPPPQKARSHIHNKSNGEHLSSVLDVTFRRFDQSSRPALLICAIKRRRNSFLSRPRITTITFATVSLRDNRNSARKKI